MKKNIREGNVENSSKFNYVFDFENQDLSIPVNDSMLSRKFIDFKEFAIAYIAVACGQIFDSKKTIYKYYKEGFYFDIFLEQANIAILFVQRDGVFSDEYMEKIEVYCNVYKMKLGVVYLNSSVQGDDVYVSSDGIMYANITANDSIDMLMGKIDILLWNLIKIYLPKLWNYKNELNEQMDKELCKNLAILLSLKKK